LIVNGVDSGTTATTDASGNYSLAGAAVSSLTGGEVVTVYLDDQTENGVTVSTMNATSITGVDIYQDHLIARSDNGSGLTSVQLNLADNVDPGASSDDISTIYTMDGSNNLTTAAGVDLFIPNGQTLDLGGSITVAGDLVLDDGATLVTNTNAISATGALHNGLTAGDDSAVLRVVRGEIFTFDDSFCFWGCGYACGHSE